MTNRVAQRLGVAYPIVQGPFGGGLSTTRLAAAVSELGGLGSYGAHHLAPEDIGRVAAELRALTSRPFALNLWVSDHDPGGLALDEREFERVTRLFEPWYRELGVEPPAMPARYGERYDEQVDALLAARPPVFSFVFGVPARAVLAECRRRGIVTIGTATSVAEARLLEEAGVDIVVATRLRGRRSSAVVPRPRGGRADGHVRTDAARRRPRRDARRRRRRRRGSTRRARRPSRSAPRACRSARRSSRAWNPARLTNTASSCSATRRSRRR